MSTWSWSRLSTHNQCPRRYWHRWIERTKALVLPTSPELFFGVRLHEAMSFLYKRHADGIMPPDEVVIDFFRDGWERRPEGKASLELRADGPADYELLGLGERAIMEHFNRYEPFDADRTVALEANLIVELGDGFQFGGRADRIAIRRDGVWVVCDYKTTARLPRRQDLEKDGQLPLYGLGVQRAWPAAKEIELRWEFLRLGGADSIMADAVYLEAVRQRTLGQIREIESHGRDPEAFPISPGPLCRTCQYQHCCEGGRHAYELRIGGQPAPAMRSVAELVDDWAAADGERKTAAEMLGKIEERIENIKLALSTIADAENLAVIHGNAGEVRITRRDELIPPRKTHEPDAAAALEAALRASPWWGEVSGLDRHRIMSALSQKSNAPPELRSLLGGWAIRSTWVSMRLKRR